MPASLIFLCIYLVACIFCESVVADKAQSNYIGQLRYAGHLLDAPIDHFLGYDDDSANSYAKDLSTNIVELYSALGLQEGIVVDVFSGWGISYFPLASVVGSGGIIVAIEIDQMHFDCLKQNSMDKFMWGRTLLIHGDPRERKLGLNTAHSISNVVSGIGLDCPRLIRINDHAGLKPGDAFGALVGGISLIGSCRPIVLVDCRRDDPAVATAMVEFFSLLGDRAGYGAYSMHWFDIEHTLVSILPDGGSNSSKWTTASLLAVPAEHVELVKQVKNLSNEEVKQHNTSTQSHKNTWDDAVMYIHQSMAPSVATTEQGATLDSNCPAAHISSGQEAEITVHLRDIVAPVSPLGSLQFQASLASRQLDALSLTYRFSSGVSMNVENLEMIATVHCGVWLQRLAAHSDDEAHSEAPLDRGDLAQACTAFLEKRLRTLRRIFALRALTLTYPDLVLDPKATTDTFFPGTQLDPAAVVTEHSYYQLKDGPSESRTIAPGHVMESWFAHAPFKTRSDEAACGEPIWCSHTAEMQRRIFAWQNPDKSGSVPGSSGSPHHFSSHATRDWSSVPRPCASAKFLVYEPISNHQGIGSLLELIAVTMRYAICLDRILIVNFVDQEPTLQKWMHPGCRGSFAECYFQPLSSCPLAAEDIRTARVSQDGFEFDAYPQREERVLVLKGMPLEGKCTLCHSEWAAQSRFFDGLMIGGGTFNGSDKGHLKHATAFLGSIKQTWASQFLRYVMRPRAWLQEAVSQIVHFSMQSPVPDSHKPGSRGGTNRTDIPVGEFPRSFLSLHVRFGMKAVENALMPLSRYMGFISRKLPHVRDIFLSTETEAVVWTLRGLVSHLSHRNRS